MARPTRTVQDPAFLRAALEGLELQRGRIDEQIRMVKSLLGKKGGAPAASPGAAKAPRRQLSEAARKRIAAAQKKRWAEYRKARAGS